MPQKNPAKSRPPIPPISAPPRNAANENPPGTAFPANTPIENAKDSGRYKVANCTQAQPVFYGFAGLPDGKVILVSVLRVRGTRPPRQR